MDTPPPSSRRARVPCCLALKHVVGSDEPAFFSVSEGKTIDMDAAADDLGNRNCWATPQGWVLVRDAAASSTYLLDPHGRSGRRIQLPHLTEDDALLNSFCTCLLSDYPDPAGDDLAGRSYVVLLLHTDSPLFWYCHVGGGDGDGDGGGEWVKHEYDIGTLPLPDLGESRSEKVVICSIAACRGKFYFNCTFGELGVLEFSPAPVLGSIAIRGAFERPSSGGFRRVAMVESQGDLFMVSLLSATDLGVVYRVHVHRMDFSKQEWVEAGGIGDGRAFLLASWYFGASRSAAECGLEPDCIYTAYPWKKRVMIFNVKDGTMAMQDMDEAPESRQALWLLPTYP